MTIPSKDDIWEFNTQKNQHRNPLLNINGWITFLDEIEIIFLYAISVENGFKWLIFFSNSYMICASPHPGEGEYTEIEKDLTSRSPDA